MPTRQQKTKNIMATDSQANRRTDFEVSGEVEQDDEPDGICTVDSTDASTKKLPNKITRATYVFAFCAALNSAIIGYDTGVSTDAARKVQITFDLTDVEREFFVGCLNFFAMFGAMTAQYFTGNYGHRRTFLIAAGGFMMGMLIMAISSSLRQLMVGRALVGLAVGTGLAIDPMYIAEITPSEHRGRLVSWTEIATNIGLLLGFSTSLFFAGWSDETQWRAMFAVGMIPPACLILAVVFIMPESPRWLVSKNRLEESKRVLEMIYPQDHDVDQIVETIRVTMHKENNMNHAIGWKMFLRPSPSMARMLMVGLTILVMQQACGIDAILYYLMDVFAQAGITSSLYQSLMLIFLGFIKLIFVFVASFYFDKIGRRSVLFISLSGMALSLLLVSFSFFFESSWTPALSITGLALYLAFFSSGLGPGAWLVPSEVFANSIRAKAMSVGTFLNRATATILATTFLSVADAISWGGFFLLLCGLCLATLLFLFIYLPETKGRTLEEMTKLFAEITGDDTILVAERTVEAEEEEEEMQTPVSYETSDPVVDQVRQID